MIIDCAHYQDGRRRDEGAVPLQEAGPGAGRAASSGWDCSSPEKRSYPRCAIPSACMSWRSRTHRTTTCGRKSKLRPGRATVILRTARYDDAAEEVEFGEISVFLAPTFVITVRQGVASELRGARQRLEQRPELLAAGSASALWAVLDQVVDGYAPVVAGLEHDIDQIEVTVFSGAAAPTNGRLAAPRGHRFLPRRPPAARRDRHRRAHH